MNKQLIIALGLVVLATPALASKARLAALGEDIYGSFYISDNRNIFYNAAQLNNHKDLVTMEWGNTTAAKDSDQSPRAEGGFFKSAGNLVYGIQLGSESNSSNGLRTAAGVVAYEENNLDLFIAGDAGIKWGANLTYSKSAKNEITSGLGTGFEASNNKQEAIRTRFGMIVGDLEGYANINIANKAESTLALAPAPIPDPSGNNEFKENTSYQIGAIYNLMDYRLFADYRSQSGEAQGGANLDGKLSSSQLQVGAGRATKLNDKATLFTKVQYERINAENKTGVAQDVGLGGDWLGGLATCDINNPIFCKKFSASFIPVVVGLEFDAASWLVLRGSVAQAIWGNQKASDKSGITESTTLNGGASVKFGEASIDGSVSNDNTTNVTYSRVAMTYRF